jgi:hypothetical protein
VSEELARLFHEVYERRAPEFGYETRPDTKEFDPHSRNGRLMIAVCAEVVGELRAKVAELETAFDKLSTMHAFVCAERDEARTKVEELERLCVNARGIIVDAIMHGMPVTQQVADVRNGLVKIKCVETALGGET